MKVYKGFDRNLKCRGFQYREGGEYETDKAKLREALKLCMDEMCNRCRDLASARGNPLPCLQGCEPVRKAKAALAEPPRNCDKYDNAKDAWFAFDALQSKKGAKWHWTEYADWLFAPAQEGGNDGR